MNEWVVKEHREVSDSNGPCFINCSVRHSYGKWRILDWTEDRQTWNYLQVLEMLCLQRYSGCFSLLLRIEKSHCADYPLIDSFIPKLFFSIACCQGTNEESSLLSNFFHFCSVVVQSLSRVRFFVIPWTAACQASPSLRISQSLLTLMSIESVMPSSILGKQVLADYKGELSNNQSYPVVECIALQREECPVWLLGNPKKGLEWSSSLKGTPASGERVDFLTIKVWPCSASLILFDLE